MTEYQAVVCACGAEGRREIPPSLKDRFRELLLATPFSCERCSERAEREAAEEAASAQAVADRRAFRHRLRTSGLPEAFHAASLARLEMSQAEARADAARWASGELKGLMLSGPVGAGKTFTAAAAAVAAMRRRGVTWRFAPSLLQQLLTDRADIRHRQAIDALLGDGYGALVLDDLDKPRPSEYAAEQLLAAIDNRISAGRPLLVTMNTEPAEIVERYPAYYGEAITSRLVGYCAWHRIDGPDRRFEGAVP